MKNFHQAEDIVEMVTNLKDPCTNFKTKHIPKDLTTIEEGSKIKMKMWEIRVKKYMDREEVLTENTKKLYGIVIGQCTPPLRSTIKHDEEYGIKSLYFDTLWLLKKIKKMTAGVDINTNPALTLHEQMLIFITTRQGHSESDDEYLNKFNS